MNKPMVYDLPMRIFHWVFAGLFITSFLIAKTVDDESVIFSYHMLAGITLSATVLLRILWGLVGTRHARFASFPLKPTQLAEYFKSMITGKTKLYAGHNPASSWAAILMMTLALGLGLTGYLMANGQKESFEDIHELLANLFLITAAAHVAGIVFHTFIHKDMIGLSMLNGKKNTTEQNSEIQSTQPLVALVFVLLLLAFSLNLINNFNSNTRTLNLFGNVLQLGENENSDGLSEDENKDNPSGDDEDEDRD